jgi:energy-coupling factor transporter ATP-binding protein EcfA2
VRFKSVSIAWFRGAAAEVALSPEGKSLVVYGSNGSGKSSFVDAIELAINGKISHLSHEYSGKRQERGIPNSHRKPSDATAVKIRFQDNTERLIAIAPDGAVSSTGSESPAIASWDYKRTVLRQNEVAAFIGDTKGDKYSAILPLLGLGALELTAENLRQLGKAVEESSKLRENRAFVRQTQTTRITNFQKFSDDMIAAAIHALATEYLVENDIPETSDEQASKTMLAIDARIASLTRELREHVTTRAIADIDLDGHLRDVRDVAGRLRASMEPLIEERLGVLENAAKYLVQSPEHDSAVCPACGSLVSKSDFALHVETERARLAAASVLRDERADTVGKLVDAVSEFKNSLLKADLDKWCETDARHSGARDYLRQLDLKRLRRDCTDESLDGLEAALSPVHAAAVSHSKGIAPDAEILSNKRKIVEAAKNVLDGIRATEMVERAEKLIEYLASVEQSIRDQLKTRACEVIEEISMDVQQMWSILHPDKLIADVALYMPPDVDKAIDIRLSFYGVDQASPRLTLSEGYRNSLGLCIFLAMAKRDTSVDRPLILDDVIVSLDRQHRASLVDVLQKEFAGRQVILFTHDREWYIELKALLTGATWTAQTLLPYESPEVGIRWTHKSTTFADARTLLNSRPDAAGNDARKIMDIELSIVAEKLQVRLPYLRGERNDMRMAHSFLERIISDGKKCFLCEGQTAPVQYSAALDSLDVAARALAAWGNKASHSFDVIRPEATKLLDACETALAVFQCAKCRKPVWFAQAGGPQWLQCECSSLRWRYGKAP